MPKSKTLVTRALQKRETTDILSLIRRAEAGDKAAMTALRPLIDQTPGAWEMAGNLATRAENALVSVAAGKDEILREALTRKLAALKVELGGETPLERLLVERLVDCWLNVYYIDALYAMRMNNLTWAESEYFQRRQERANRQYLLAIRTLAQVRRLLVPPVQVNIGAQQLNVANASNCEQRNNRYSHATTRPAPKGIKDSRTSRLKRASFMSRLTEGS